MSPDSVERFGERLIERHSVPVVFEYDAPRTYMWFKLVMNGGCGLDATAITDLVDIDNRAEWVLPQVRDDSCSRAPASVLAVRTRMMVSLDHCFSPPAALRG